MSREFRLGIFVVVALLILSAGIFWIGRNRYMFSRTYRLEADFQNVAGLGDGADVRVGGIHEGTVKRINLPRRPEGPVTVVMALEEPTRSVIRKDSVASIKAEGLVGDKYVEISFGSKDAAPVRDGDRIEGVQPQDVSDLINKANQVLDTTQTTIQTAQTAIANVADISSKINHGQGTIGGLVNDKSVYRNVASAAASLNDDMEALKHNFLLRGFFKKRGYEDSSELTAHEVPRLPATASMKTFTFDAHKLFDKPNGVKLKDEKALDEAGKFLEDNDKSVAVVTASAGPKGDEDKDRVVSEARALAIRNYILQKFRVDDPRLKTLGTGRAAEGTDGQVQVLVYPARAATELAWRGHPSRK